MFYGFGRSGINSNVYNGTLIVPGVVNTWNINSCTLWDIGRGVDSFVGGVHMENDEPDITLNCNVYNTVALDCHTGSATADDFQDNDSAQVVNWDIHNSVDSDGSIALNDYYDSGGPPEFIDEPFRIGAGGNLTDDHPIGVTAEYPISGSTDFNAPVLSPSGLYGFGGDFSPDVPLFPFRDEQVVSSGTFLIASESRLRAAMEQW